MVLPGTDSSIIAPVTFGAIHFITYNENEARLSSAYPRIQKSFARPTPPRNERIFRTKQEKQLYIPSTHPQQHLVMIYMKQLQHPCNTLKNKRLRKKCKTDILIESKLNSGCSLKSKVKIGNWWFLVFNQKWMWSCLHNWKPISVSAKTFSTKSQTRLHTQDRLS